MRRSALLLFTIVIYLTGCGEISERHNQENSKTTEVATTNSTMENKNEEKRNAEIKEQSIISAQAIYIGLMDTHTIEVMINNQPLAIQINEEQFKILEPLNTNKQIHIEYYYNDETSQNILDKVEVH
ncbi:hypothetical protein [Metabacillus bambusae]|uniref:DUF3221 domain-containing protein n=1 Tax=Metabacillus bambusae TaxID=2795218 RepID=A0ABS3MYI3_9BACI|nr:hypothetical protein [Metabacillus bambusae]MBO1510949.1 hypothetical protein [Metabacillus bambusae]